ncbi:MAG TPA: alpha/beta hydrolase [Marmoricola sp.]|nr:alpha/beta hydrolase [Marmoricola sp.]
MSRVRSLSMLAGTGVAALAAGGMVLERRLRARRDSGPDEPVPLGSLRGEVHKVTADDGVVLHAEVDEVAPYASSADRPEAATVVFVHGFALTMDCWHFQRLAFRGKRRMVFFDQRSHGRSDRSEKENATIDQLGRDLRTVLDAFAPGEPVVLVGHSMGGMSIVALAEHHPELFGERIVGLGLVSTTAGGQRTHKILSRHIPDALGRRAVERGLLVASQRDRLLELVRRSGSAVSLRVIEEFAFGDTDVPSSYAKFVDSMIAATPLQVLVEFIPQFDALDKFHVVKAFSEVPTLILCGTKDKLTSMDHARKLKDHVAGSRLVELEGGGHMPIMEFKERVNDELEQLFADADEQARR